MDTAPVTAWVVTFEHLYRRERMEVWLEAPTGGQAILKARTMGADFSHSNAKMIGLRAVDADGNTIIMREPGVFVAPRPPLPLPASCYGMLP